MAGIGGGIGVATLIGSEEKAVEEADAFAAAAVAQQDEGGTAAEDVGSVPVGGEAVVEGGGHFSE